MTDNEIIKALECCGNGLCANCPRLNTPEHILHCKELLMCEAIDLINRKKAEIKRLNGVIKNFKATKERQKAEIESEISLRQQWQEKCNELLEERQHIKAEAIKQFAEKVKEHMCSYDLDNYHYFRAIEEDAFDDLVKEMVGDNNVG